MLLFVWFPDPMSYLSNVKLDTVAPPLCNTKLYIITSKDSRLAWAMLKINCFAPICRSVGASIGTYGVLCCKESVTKLIIGVKDSVGLYSPHGSHYAENSYPVSRFRGGSNGFGKEITVSR